MPRNKELISGTALVLAGGFSLICSTRYSFWDRYGPGPGFFPFVLSAVLILLSAILFIRAIVKRPVVIRPETFFPAGSQARLLEYLLCFLGFFILFPILGYLITIFCFVLVCQKFLEKQSLAKSLSLSFFAIIVIHLLFVKFLGTALPLGFPGPFIPGLR